MRKKILIGLALYLAFGVVFGLVTDRQKYMCAYILRAAGTYQPLPEVGPPSEIPRDCLPISNAGERLRWVAVATSAWLPLLIRDIARDDVTTFK